ncbi:hypothetical protein TPR58_20460 [Sphingomonas sp. HF-S3]|uniref:Uncharacterized protein n=1 Tax=Sphingomonas rustica TaxID=3103142 RepID=A0ABV0BE89_9SPHN
MYQPGSAAGPIGAGVLAGSGIQPRAQGVVVATAMPPDPVTPAAAS